MKNRNFFKIFQISKIGQYRLNEVPAPSTTTPLSAIQSSFVTSSTGATTVAAAETSAITVTGGAATAVASQYTLPAGVQLAGYGTAVQFNSSTGQISVPLQVAAVKESGDYQRAYSCSTFPYTT